MKKKLWRANAWVCTFGFFAALYIGRPWHEWLAFLLGALFSAMWGDSI